MLGILDRVEVKAILLTIALILAGIFVSYAIYQFTFKIPSKGEIATIGINIIDENGQTIKEIDWGKLYPGSSKTFKVYAYNNGSIPVILDLTTEAWNPPIASDYILLTWDYNGTTIEPGKKIPITLTLTVVPSISGIRNFSFLIVITAIGG